MIQGSSVLGEFYRIMVGEYQHRGAQQDLSRGGCQVRQGGQGMIIRFIVESLSDVAIIKQVVHDPDGVVAQLLGYRPQCQDVLWVCYAPVVGNGHTKFHKFLQSMAAKRAQSITGRGLTRIHAARAAHRNCPASLAGWIAFAGVPGIETGGELTPCSTRVGTCAPRDHGSRRGRICRRGMVPLCHSVSTRCEARGRGPTVPPCEPLSSGLPLFDYFLVDHLDIPPDTIP